MHKQTSIIRLYDDFLKYLEQEKDRIAPLQLTGRIEDYLVKEFIYYIYTSTKGRTFALPNLGNRGEQKIDISLIKNDKRDKDIIYGLIEAKYLRNRHRMTDSNATDEICPCLRRLDEQIDSFKSKTHGGYDVQLLASSNSIYGLVFASFVMENQSDEQKKKMFYDRILKKAEKFFRYHDYQKPYFRPVYDDIQIEVLNKNFFVSLKAGLWKVRKS